MPEGLILRPLILFSFCMLPLGHIINRHAVTFHYYADNNQLYLTVEPNNLSDLSCLVRCLTDIKDLISANMIWLNSHHWPRKPACTDQSYLDATANNIKSKHLVFGFCQNLDNYSISCLYLYLCSQPQIYRHEIYNIRSVFEFKRCQSCCMVYALKKGYSTPFIVTHYTEAVVSGSDFFNIKKLWMWKNCNSCCLKSL